MYELTHQNEIQNYENRIDAVNMAKELTLASDGRSTVNITDGIETLSYRGGKLVAYSYETRRSSGGSSESTSFNQDTSSKPSTPDAAAAPTPKSTSSDDS
jgi:hypothetical protein